MLVAAVRGVHGSPAKSGAAQQIPYRHVAAGAFLSSRNVPITIDQHIERKTLGIKLCYKIGVLRQHDVA